MSKDTQKQVFVAKKSHEPHTELMSPIVEEPKGSIIEEPKGSKDASCSPFDRYQTLLNVNNPSSEVDKKETLVSASDSAINDEDSEFH